MTELLALAMNQSPWEGLAVTLAILYLVLVIRENIWCWVAAGVSTLIYLVLFFRVGLYMESALQVFYLGMAGFGWWQWRYGGPRHDGLPITTWPVRKHFINLVVIAALTLCSGWALARYTDAAFPYLDSATTWAAIATTYMVARKKLENWVYWFVIDAVSIYLYLGRGMTLTALLFALYLVLIVFGYLRWSRVYQARPAPLAA